jgi:hypothetical protein
MHEVSCSTYDLLTTPGKMFDARVQLDLDELANDPICGEMNLFQMTALGLQA